MKPGIPKPGEGARLVDEHQVDLTALNLGSRSPAKPRSDPSANRSAVKRTPPRSVPVPNRRRGTEHYRGGPRDYSREPSYDPQPSRVVEGVKRRVYPRLAEAVVRFVYLHNRRVRRAKRENSHRLTHHYVADSIGSNRTSVKDVIRRLVKAGELEVVSTGRGRAGAIYHVPERSRFTYVDSHTQTDLPDTDSNTQIDLQAGRPV